jgi:hypothetical protein
MGKILQHVSSNGNKNVAKIGINLMNIMEYPKNLYHDVWFSFFIGRLKTL